MHYPMQRQLTHWFIVCSCQLRWTVDKQPCFQLIVAVSTMITSLRHSVVPQHKQHSIILHLPRHIAEYKIENMYLYSATSDTNGFFLKTILVCQ